MPNSLISKTEYIPEREALLVYVDLGEYLIDYYLHRREFAPETLVEQDEKLKELIACFAIHLTLHSSAESHAWTVHVIAESPYSLFVTGSAGQLDEYGITHGFLVGHVLTENIRHTDVNSFHAQFTDSKGNSFKSYVRCESSEISEMVEHFYSQSEQHPLRIRLSKTSDKHAALVALPSYDEAWFQAADVEGLGEDTSIVRSAMRTCFFDFYCDCSPEKLLPFFRGLTEEGVSELYGEDEKLTITCPRCARQFFIDRSEIDEADTEPTE